MNKIILSIFINSKRKKFIVPNVLKKIYLFVFNHNPLTSKCNIHYPLTSEAEINLYTEQKNSLYEVMSTLKAVNYNISRK